MKDNEKKVKAVEEVKEEVQTEENGVQLTDEELSSVAGGISPTPRSPVAESVKTAVDAALQTW